MSEIIGEIILLISSTAVAFFFPFSTKDAEKKYHKIIIIIVGLALVGGDTILLAYKRQGIVGSLLCVVNAKFPLCVTPLGTVSQNPVSGPPPSAPPTPAVEKPLNWINGRWTLDGYSCEVALTFEAATNRLSVFEPDGARTKSYKIVSQTDQQLVGTDGSSRASFDLSADRLHYEEGEFSGWFDRCA